MTTTESSKDTPRVAPEIEHNFKALDAVRAIGAVAVVATHAGFNAGIYTEFGWFGRLIARMDVGVAVFFVLSGFLLSRPWLSSSLTGNHAPGVPRYLWKRILRVMPAYVVTVVVALTLMPQNEGLGIGDWTQTLMMLGIYSGEPLPHGLAHTWSLATELAFYVALPLLMLCVIRLRWSTPTVRLWVVVVIMSAVALAWIGWLAPNVPGANVHGNEWLPGFLTWFGAGIGLAFLDVKARTGGQVARPLVAIAASPGAAWAAVLALMLVAGTSIAGPTFLVAGSPEQMLAKNLLYTAIAMLVVIPSIFAPTTNRYVRLLSTRPLRHLGHISYSIFLIHMPLLSLVMWIMDYDLFDGHFASIFFFTMFLTLIVAELIYRVVELPAMRLRSVGRDRMSRGLRTNTPTTATKAK